MNRSSGVHPTIFPLHVPTLDLSCLQHYHHKSARQIQGRITDLHHKIANIFDFTAPRTKPRSKIYLSTTKITIGCEKSCVKMMVSTHVRPLTTLFLPHPCSQHTLHHFRSCDFRMVPVHENIHGVHSATYAIGRATSYSPFHILRRSRTLYFPSRPTYTPTLRLTTAIAYTGLVFRPWGANSKSTL